MLLSGELDPVTPPAYGEMARELFDSARHLVVTGQGHHVLSRGCVAKLAAHFIRHLSLPEKPERCVKQTARLPFFIDLLGPGA